MNKFICNTSWFKLYLPKKLAKPKHMILKPKNKKNKGWIIALILLLILASVGYGLYLSNKLYLRAYYQAYTYNRNHNSFKRGNKMYLVDFLVDTTSAKKFARYNENLYRMIRPLNYDEIDAMDATLAEKALIKKDLSSKKPYMFESAWAISTDSLCKYKSAFISYYSDAKIADSYYGEGIYLPGLFYVVHPIRKALIRTSDIDQLPSGYKYDDDFPFYLEVRDVSNVDSKTFREIK